MLSNFCKNFTAIVPVCRSSGFCEYTRHVTWCEKSRYTEVLTWSFFCNRELIQSQNTLSATRFPLFSSQEILQYFCYFPWLFPMPKTHSLCINHFKLSYQMKLKTMEITEIYFPQQWRMTCTFFFHVELIFKKNTFWNFSYLTCKIYFLFSDRKFPDWPKNCPFSNLPETFLNSTTGKTSLISPRFPAQVGTLMLKCTIPPKSKT